MKKEICDIEINNKFSYFTEIINKESREINLKLIFGESDIDFEIDNDMYFKVGYLLMLLYIFNGDFNDDIIYNNGVFYTKSIEINNESSVNIKVENIANNIIHKSIYYKRFLSSFTNKLNSKSLKDIETGFTNAYNIFINKKIELLRQLDINKDTNLINMIKILNYNDLKMQTKFLRLRIGDLYEKNTLLEDLKEYEIYDDKFINTSCKLLNSILEKSIIGIGKYGLEMMWIQYDGKKLCPTKYNSIYIAIYLNYIGIVKNTKYYFESTNQIINSVLNNLDTTKNKLSLKLFKILYFNRSLISYCELNEYLRKNEKYIENILTEDKERFTIDTDKKAIDFIKNEAINVLDKIII